MINYALKYVIVPRLSEYYALLTVRSLIAQLCRIFPISVSFYLSKLVFSPHSSTKNSPRILIGLEAHSEEEYNLHVAPYQGRAWPAPVLRFMVYDKLNLGSARIYTESANSTLNRNSVASIDSVALESCTSDAASAKAPAVNDERKVLIERLRERISSRSISSPSPMSSEDDASTTVRPSPQASLLTI